MILPTLEYLKSIKSSPVIHVTDVETGSTGQNAHIFSASVVTVDLYQHRIINQTYMLISDEGQENRIKDDINQPNSTMAFWEKQKVESPEAYAELFSAEKREESLSLHEALHQIAYYIKENTPEGTKAQVMGNGPEFDNVILSHAYEETGIDQPWHFRGNQSLRTVCLLGRLLLGIDPKYTLERKGPLHHALYDALHEAEYLLEITSSLISAIVKGHNVVDMETDQQEMLKGSLLKALGYKKDSDKELIDLLAEVEFNRKALHSGEAEACTSR
ncbi:putative exodeoxyribonuclease [Vibrio nigripulchritudo SOn1]|uniref:Exodeoxyribonuclease n=1 Tax=Vibrio nigripulchritudo SOn1 TaxID=1238450 RepID=A0AAV2VPN4_9VIBR|nr:3'-5' exonuclease [Vibrio nigripulchritudo]CCO46683.1 putative exodeoxyribonuclease [Vibrio nigripulchritudo SOn1]